jgi:hypothetical protein
MTDVLFTSSAYVKQFSVLQQNVNDPIINVTLAKSQDKYIKPLLGLPLYNFLVTSIKQNNGLSGLNPDYIDLVENHIVPTLVSWVIFESSLTLTFKFTNKSIGKFNDQFQEASSLDEIKYLRGELRNEAEWYQRRLLKYLIENKDKFPQYTEESYDLQSSKQTGRFSSGIAFKKQRKRLIKTYSEDELNNGVRIIGG